MAGVGQYHAAMYPVGGPRPPPFCLLNPAPSRVQVVAGCASLAVFPASDSTRLIPGQILPISGDMQRAV